jgi:hypothetical protein
MFSILISFFSVCFDFSNAPKTFIMDSSFRFAFFRKSFYLMWWSLTMMGSIHNSSFLSPFSLDNHLRIGFRQFSERTMGNYQSQNSSLSRRQGSSLTIVVQGLQRRKKNFVFNRCIYQKHKTLNNILMQHSFVV